MLKMRKIHTAPSSEVLAVSTLAKAGSSTPSGEVKECTRSPAVKVSPWPVARFFDAR